MSGKARSFRDSEANKIILKWILEWMSNQWSQAKIREMCLCLLVPAQQRSLPYGDG